MEKKKEIFINVSAGSTRISIIEDSILVELYIELPEQKRMVGSIFKGVIQNVIPGMQAAFVDVGTKINSFLPFSEIDNSDNLGNLSLSEDEDAELEEIKQRKKKQKPNFDPAKDLKINDEILIQVIKEPYAGKGARVTTDISLPGSLIVIVPNSNFIGISRKISDKYEKRRLRRIIKELKPAQFGVIVRTIAAGKDQSNIEADMNRLLKAWEELNRISTTQPGPVKVYQDFSTADQVIRDLFTPEVERIVIDDKKVYKRMFQYIKEVSPNQVDKLLMMNKKGAIFDTYNLEEQIEKALRRKVWLKSGAYLIIEQTEAMLVIDVNSGRFIGKKDHEHNSLRINIEAAREVARQLRLRDTGGLIVIDFIDLQDPTNRKKVYDEFKQALKADKAKVSLADFSPFGLLEMTRQRVRLSVVSTVTDMCPVCNGLGIVTSKDIVLTLIESWLKRYRAKYRDKRLIIYVHPELKNFIDDTKKKLISGFMWDNWLLLELKEDPNISLDEFRIFSKSQKKDVTEDV